MPHALRTVWIILPHLRLPASRLDRFLSGLGECGSFHREFLCNLSISQHLVAVGALAGIQPYINSSIIIQLLTVAIPALERMQREGGEEGKKKIQSITRYS